MTDADLFRALDDELPRAIELRHALHADPYVSGHEGPTAAAVVSALGWGEGERVAGTGRLVAREQGGVVLRAELDALPVTEATDVPWRATGAAMHACGHDVHLAALVAAVRAIASCDPIVPVAALLQPREEAPPSGALEIVESGALDRYRARAIVAAHVQPQLPAGVVCVTPGVVNASVDHFEITVHGHGGHAGYPHTVRDPILAASATVVALQQLASRRVDPTRGAVCTIGRIEGGTAGNVVPDKASLVGSLRLMTVEDRAPMLAALTEVATGTAAAYGCHADVRLDPAQPPVINHAPVAEAAAAVLESAGIPVDRTWRSFGSDDFSHYSADRPSLMAFVGVDGGAGLHEARFLPPDATVSLVARTLVAGYLAAARLV